ncbi:beta-ketoacyl synthase N-terminal-like domain-containing protein [Desulfocurvibacter africanus]|uniref:Beta-ketoacyl-acyl-carrier-protein synthase I n=1 Tax=Desulfocurvibacter africanus subsp. africanus str. Walvis Bay TaxID=690850 RepID=F3YZC4_DESAF|nr:beta-ketoacyl synthase N-terminal-like domain-containing protein [Desulfocurvibacter africanus]EGJ51953.1 Beta-ketoacyl-acyl-carrier-protein synthase I [Desulfocurvibacter africanus subsp. africanus str. Walvis Bay]
MNRVAVVEARAVTALGDLDATWRGLLAGRSGIAPVARFDATGCISRWAACVPGLERDSNARSLLLSLLDRLLDGAPSLAADTPLLAATTKAGIDVLESIERHGHGRKEDVPPSLLAEETSRRLGLCGRRETVSGACASATIALARAGALIAHGKADSVLVVCADLVSEFVFTGFSSLRALSPEPAKPFDARRDGLTLGEGAALLLLMSETRAKAEKRPILARLAGWGVANDATHITAPARNGCGLIATVNRCLAVAGANPDDVAAICAHGTGTVYNDAMELTAFRSVFGERKVPVHGVKGALGHAMGASGGIEAALCCRMLADCMLPPTIGMSEPDPAAAGLVRSEPTPLPAGLLLTTNSGFGGINAALLFSAPKEIAGVRGESFPPAAGGTLSSLSGGQP